MDVLGSFLIMLDTAGGLVNVGKRKETGSACKHVVLAVMVLY